ncbi:MAG: hypothetical protein A2571_00505 [Candidatus Vogelbacteria bacterium RIFOXYD1_FULL_44_32]|uniref:Uncharacterized protein n=1 Tax=Candidatus Vogelbacteria bacterium RIFOXYD1_FULL_44_32 TaxID=1802438 RepID=A0A1G2QFR0_9BACT|nr:MAG: hypothetical protein A2571_00505 [Candidatus Vogelbacteria bacterium RIFOXYD1_FULL_44_32]
MNISTPIDFAIVQEAKKLAGDWPLEVSRQEELGNLILIFTFPPNFTNFQGQSLTVVIEGNKPPSFHPTKYFERIAHNLTHKFHGQDKTKKHGNGRR